MPNKKMTFPPVPGDTPREKFINLVRHVFSISKNDLDKPLAKSAIDRGKRRRNLSV
jgi:hypothetical protein